MSPFTTSIGIGTDKLLVLFAVEIALEGIFSINFDNSTQDLAKLTS